MCDICGKEFLSQKYLENHLAKHVNANGETIEKIPQKNTYLCEYCPFKAQSPQHLRPDFITAGQAFGLSRRLGIKSGFRKSLPDIFPLQY